MKNGPYLVEVDMDTILDYYATGGVSDSWIGIPSPEAWAELTRYVDVGGEVILYASVPEQKAAVAVQAVVVAFDETVPAFEVVA